MKIKEIVTFDGSLEEAFPPLAVTLTTEDEIDASRGDMFVRPGNVPQVSDSFDAILVWMNQEAMVPGKTYLFKHTTQTLAGSIDTLRYQIDVNTLHRSPSPQLELNEIGRVGISLNGPIFYDAYRSNPGTGAFIVIDRISNATVAAGMILDRSADAKATALWDEAHPGQDEDAETLTNEGVSSEERAARFGQQPVTVLLTGLTGSGKSTVGRALERTLFEAGRAVALVDGEWVRRGLSSDLGFTAEDRSENLRRSAHLAHTLNEAGLICIAAFVAPGDAVRRRAAKVVGGERFLVVHVATPLEVCRERDTKGQYAEADAGKLPDFPGVTAPYEVPEDADLTIDPSQQAVTDCVEAILALLRERGAIK